MKSSPSMRTRRPKAPTGDHGISCTEDELEGGFTLVEVLAALAILSVGLSVLTGVIVTGLDRSVAAEKLLQAVSLTQSLVAKTGADIPIRSGVSEGASSAGYDWRLTIQQHFDSSARPASPFGAYLIHAEVAWTHRSERQSYALTTLRIAPSEVRQ